MGPQGTPSYDPSVPTLEAPMRTALALIALLSACEPAPELAETEALPEDAAAAPAAFALTATNAVAGGALVLTATGVPPGASVRFAVSTVGIGPGACPPVLAGKCLGIRSPANLLPNIVVASPLGVATYSYNVAGLLGGSSIAAQAAVVSGAVSLSNAVDRKVAPPGTVINPTVDSDGDGYTVATGDCAEFERRISPIQGDLVNDFHDQNCDDLDGVDADRDQVASVASGGADCDDSTALTYPGAPEVCDAEDNSCDGALPPTAVWASPGGPSIGGANDTFAVHYEVSSDYWIERLRFRGRAYAPNWSETMRLYEATGPGQQYNLVATFPQAAIEGPAAPYNWFVHDNLNLHLLAGHSYIFEVESTAALRIFNSGAPTPAVSYPWGDLTAAWASTTHLPPSFNAAPANTNNILWQLISWHEIDQDGDGLLACADCDDNDPADITCVP